MVNERDNPQLMATPLIFGVRRKATLLHHTEISPAGIGVRKGRYVEDRRLERPVPSFGALHGNFSRQDNTDL